MLDLLARLFASVAGLAAVVFGLHSAAPEPSPTTARDGIEALELAPGLAATLVAEAPTITNPTNIDVDSRGRIWLLEGFNYRKFKTKPLRAAGDRVVILEDTTGDGVSDKTHGVLPGHRHRRGDGDRRVRQQGLSSPRTRRSSSSPTRTATTSPTRRKCCSPRAVRRITTTRRTPSSSAPTAGCTSTSATRRARSWTRRAT